MNNKAPPLKVLPHLISGGCDGGPGVEAAAQEEQEGGQGHHGPEEAPENPRCPGVMHYNVRGRDQL